MNIKYLKKIYELSEKAFELDEIPIGAVVVRDGVVVGEGINTRTRDKNVVGHAEINAIEMACKQIGDWRLDDCELYVTLSPCMMCTGAIVESRVKKVYYLLDRTNVCFDANKYINLTKINNSEYEDKYLILLRSFFENKRNN